MSIEGEYAVDINEEVIDYIGESPIGIKIYSVKHYVPHFHPHSLELLYCISGKISIVAGHQHVELSKNEIFTIDCTDIHFLSSNEDNIIISLYIDLTRVNVSWDYLRYVFLPAKPYAISLIK
jgi:mannose-6-phosphate isomerase-like protein (cupin superfamily)